MRSLVNCRKIILENDATNTGSSVITGSSIAKQTQGIACVGDPVYCPACKKQALLLKGII